MTTTSFPTNESNPICQTFSVDVKSIGKVASSSAFVTKVDLYFSSRDEKFPVIVELREIDPISGYPTPYILPYGRAVVEWFEVNVSDDASAPTPIYFPSPVHVEDGKQYGIVINPAGNSPNYRLWTARLGDDDNITGARISSQPAAGMLFVSSNGRTYTALQEEDLKFTVYFANFTSGTRGIATFRNETKDFLTLSDVTPSGGFARPGEPVHSETYLKGTFVRGNNLTGNVAAGTAFAQGMVSGATGRLTFLSSTEARVRDISNNKAFKGGEPVRFRLGSLTGSIAGNSTGGLQYTHTAVGRVDYYNTATGETLLHVANVTFANSGPGSSGSAFLANRWIQTKLSNSQAKIVSVNSLNFDLLNMKADTITPSNTTLFVSSKFATSASEVDSTPTLINLNADTELPGRRYVLSRSVESNTSLSSSSMKYGSAQIRVDMITNNRYASPVLDTSRISFTTVENLLNNDSTGEENSVGGGNAKARYITRKVVLAEGQDAEDLRVYVDAYVPIGSSVKMYYKILNKSDQDGFNTARWIEMNRSTTATVISSSEDKEDFRELQFDPPAYPTGAGAFHSGLYANGNPQYVLSYRNSTGAFFQGFKYYSIKVVLLGTNPANPPRIRKLRAIAIQK